MCFLTQYQYPSFSIHNSRIIGDWSSLDIYHTIIFMNDSLPFCESLVIIHRNLHSKFCLYLIIIKFMQLRQQTWVYLVISYPFVKLPMYNHRLSSSALHRNLLESTTDSSPINFSKLQQPSGNASDEQQQLLREKVSKNWRVRKRWRLSQAILFTEGKSNDQLKKASNTDDQNFLISQFTIALMNFLAIRETKSCNWEWFHPYLRQWKSWLSVFMSFFELVFTFPFT